MLASWIAPTPLADFTRTTLKRQPYASPSTAASALSVFTWDTFDAILRARDPDADLLVVAKGKLVDVPRPRDLGAARALMRQGIGFAVRHSELHDEGLLAVSRQFERDVPGVAHVQLFVTPGGTHGYGWHYDFEDVFIAQTSGVKEYYFRDNTVARDVDPVSRPDFASYFQRESSPLMTAKLIPGDFLYLPARWWHVAVCLEDALSISVGVFTREAAPAPLATPRR